MLSSLTFSEIVGPADTVIQQSIQLTLFIFCMYTLYIETTLYFFSWNKFDFVHTVVVWYIHSTGIEINRIVRISPCTTLWLFISLSNMGLLMGPMHRNKPNITCLLLMGQIHRSNYGLMQNYYSFQPVGPAMGCSFSNLQARVIQPL